MNERNQIFPKAECLQRLALSSSGFVFDPVSGNSYTANETGLAILRFLQAGFTMSDLVGELQRQYEVEASAAEREVIEFAALLRATFR